MFNPEYTFIKSWRPYQKKVLEELDSYLLDGHVHIVAAPGAGKTILGLEILRRFNLPTLIFAPTNSIKEQWIQRLRSDFLPEEASLDWVSKDLNELKFLTVETYQSLSSTFREPQEKVTFCKSVRDAGIRVILVDEAHHLRANWWKCLEEIKSVIFNPKIIALTATPPIDVSQSEWNRYSSFCGEVDIEVGIPELVRSGTLCAHQDFICLNQPTNEEYEILNDFKKRSEKILLDLQLDSALAERLCAEELILESDGKGHFRKYQSFYLGLSVFLRNAIARVPNSISIHYKLQPRDLPTTLSETFAQELLQGLCFDLTDRLSPQFLMDFKSYKDRLYQIGAIERRRVTLSGNKQLDSLLASSSEKLYSVADILAHELSRLKHRLRAVILADYIRKEVLEAHAHSEPSLNKIGVAPIFELIRRMRMEGLSVAMLTGSVTIVPMALKESLEEKRKSYSISEISLEVLEWDSTFAYLEVRRKDQNKLILVLTELFETGELNCLVGTAALLGEGWDAPSLNTLVLATYGGSFVMSNQMRGRAIRQSTSEIDKVSNIWHLATVSPFGEQGFFQSKDLAKLKRRFQHFHGVSLSDDKVSVESGLSRMGDLEQVDVTSFNQKVFALSEKRKETAEAWKKAFLDIPKGRFLRPIKELTLSKRVGATAFILGISGQKNSGFRFGLASYLITRRFKRVANSLIECLKRSESLSGHFDKDQLSIRVNSGHIIVSLEAKVEKEQELFIENLEQCFDPFYTSDYILVNKRDFLMIPKDITKFAMEFRRSVRSAGYRGRLYSTSSKEGQERMIAIRNEYLLGTYPMVKKSVKTRWHY